jgi:hypothetical protein
MRTVVLFLSVLFFSSFAQAGSLFPPVGVEPDNKCPAGTIIFWTGDSLNCTSIADALAIPTCTGSSALQFDGKAFACLANFDANKEAAACSVECSHLPSVDYCHAVVPSGTTNNVPASAVIKKSDGTYAAVQGTTVEKNNCVVNGVGNLICTYGCSGGTWMFLNYRKQEVY